MSRRKATLENSKLRQIIDKCANLLLAPEISGTDLSREAKYVNDIRQHPENIEGLA
jgi:hypothetical protein